MLQYLRSRLMEASTWAGISAVIGAAAIVPAPYSYWAIAAGIAAVLCPDGQGKEATK